ncbi:MAG: hypothetical protein U0325_10805 [Polyangiales bacterium]
MNCSALRALTVVSFAFLSACGAVVTPAPRDAAVSDAADVTGADATAPMDVARVDVVTGCVFADGTRCAVGAVCPSPDGCNTCRCAGDGLLQCTTRACFDAGPPGCPLPGGRMCPRGQTCPQGDGCNSCACGADGTLACTGLACVDAGAPGCNRAEDCASGEECVFAVGACGAPGRCAALTDCAEIAQFCGCDGRSFAGCPGRPTRPAERSGPCATDAGTAEDVRCAGAAIGRGGGYCAGPDDGPLPVTCCLGWNCDSRQALCDRIPPTCAPGWTATVVGACYGPCVPAANCAPMRCLGGAGCPAGWRCDDTDTCVFAAR